MRDAGTVLKVLDKLADTPGGGSNTKIRPARNRLEGSYNHIFNKLINCLTFCFQNVKGKSKPTKLFSLQKHLSSSLCFTKFHKPWNYKYCLPWGWSPWLGTAWSWGGGSGCGAFSPGTPASWGPGGHSSAWPSDLICWRHWWLCQPG